MQQDYLEKREWLFVGIIMLVAIIVRFYQLGAQSYWTDEILSLGASSTSEGVSFWKKILYNVHGPLHTLIIYFLRKISLSEALLRAPSAMAGVFSVFFLYRWLVMLGKRDLALYGALFFALNPFNLYYSQELRFYSVATLLVIVSLILFERYLEDPSCRRGALLGLSLAGACLAHFSSLFLVAGLSIYLILGGRLNRRNLPSATLAALVILIILAPWLYREFTYLNEVQVVRISALPVGDRLRGELTLNVWSYPYAVYAFSVGYSFGPNLRELHEVHSAMNLLDGYWREIILVSVLFGSLAVSGLLAVARRGKLLLFLSIIISTTVLTTVVAALNIKVFNIRYLTPAFPLFIALLAYGLPVRRTPRFFVAILVCAVMGVAGWNYHVDPRYARDDVRSAVALIEDNEKEGELILCISSRGVIEHYYDGPNWVKELNPSAFGSGQVEERIEGYLEEHARIWYLRCRPWDTDPDDSLRKILESNGRRVATWAFPGVQVLLFEKPQGRTELQGFQDRDR
jgi:mannosyltransferase